MADSSTKRDVISEKDDLAVSGKKQIKFCQPCSRKNRQSEAQYFCIDCMEYQCSECSEAHKLFSFAINHNVVSEQEAEKFTVSFDMKGLDQCKLHKKLFEFICEDHDQLCCSTCAIVSHRKCHNVVEVDQKACSDMQNITTLKNDLSTICQKAEATMQSIAIKRSKISTDALKVKENIYSLKEQVQKMFEEWENSADRKIEEFQQQLFQEYDTLISSCKSCIDVVSTVLSDLQSVSENGTPSQQIIFGHQLKGQVIKLKKKTDKVNEAVRDAIICIDFDDFLKLPPGEAVEPWKVTAKYVIPIQSPSYHKSDTKTDLKLQISILLENEGGLNEEGPPSFSGMDFLPDGRLVAVRYVGDECVVFNQQLQKVGSKILTFGPRAVSAISDQEVVITSGGDKVVYFAHISKSSEVTVTKKVGVLKKYHSICVMTTNEFLVSIQDNIPAVGIISKTGETKELGLKVPLRRYPFDESACCYLKNSNKVVLADRNADTVYICDINNNTSIEVKGDNINDPRGVAVGPDDSIFVCCRKENTYSIVHLSSSGKLLASYKLDIPYPHIVCVTKDKTKMAVSNCSTKMLQLFEIDTKTD